MKKVKVGLIGLGNRGGMYYDYAINHELCEVVAIVDFKLKQQLERIGNPKIQYTFDNTDDFFAANIDLDLLVISSMDKYHYDDAKRGILHGYHLLLEKPIACTYDQVVEISNLAKEHNRKVVVCHVLRYTMFYKEIKRLIDEGVLGEIININATENVAYWHQCHSYVRGNWHNMKETAPQILTKCSHDFDIVTWLMNKKPSIVSSFGNLNFFKKENKPANSTNQCHDCPLGYNCDFNAYKFYLSNRDWLRPFMGNDLTDENIDKYLKSSNFGHCVFDMDNDTVDHQVVNIQFEDKTTASLTMNAFSRYCYRDIKVFGTKGDLVGDFEKNLIHVNLYNYKDEAFDIDIKKLTSDFSGHGGGDAIMFKELVDYLLYDKKTTSLTTLEESVVSHKMAFLSEESRLEDGMPKNIE